MRFLEDKIKSPEALKTLFELSSLKVVFTNGCFDLLHSGHVYYLEKAKQLGEVLLVALNTDASIRGIKGPTRPIHLLEDRLKVIASLESVDFVTWFSEETPLTLIQFLKPHVLVKGGDWEPSQIIGAKEVLQQNGSVHAIAYQKGSSTTEVIQKILYTAHSKNPS